MPSAERVEREKAIGRAIRHLCEGEIRAAEIELRELIAEESFWAQSSKSRQISRVEEVFRALTRRSPWPENFRAAERIYWRGRLGGILMGVPLGRLIDDLKATAAGRQNLLYYLISEGGTRASRWEMLLCQCREQEWRREKQQEARDAARFFGENAGRGSARLCGTTGTLNDEADWVNDLRQELRLVEFKLQRKIGTGREQKDLELRRQRIEQALTSKDEGRKIKGDQSWHRQKY
jgi:hypothetical protein